MHPFLHRFPAAGGKLLLLAFLCTIATPASAGIVLVSRLSDARAYANGGGGPVAPPPHEQTDFLPASLGNSARSWGEPGTADSNCTSNSQIAVDNGGTSHILGDGTAYASVGVPGGSGFDAGAGAKLIVISFTLTDRSYAYSMTGQLSAVDGSGSSEHTADSTARLTRGGVTVFELVADISNPIVTLSEAGILQPDNYTLFVEVNAYASSPASSANSSASFDFALDSSPVSTPTPTPTSTPIPTPTLTPTPTPTSTPTPAAQALNLSTRMLVQTDDNVGIGGFIITGSDPKRVLVRGIGPSLANSGVPNALADPTLELRDARGQLIASSDDWCTPPSAPTTPTGPIPENCDQIIATGLAPTDDLESVILITLNPGAYTAILSGKNNTSGVALVEVYDLNSATTDSKVANISTRAFVETDSNGVIAGFILGGNGGDDSVVLRGIGPSLPVSNALANPTLELHNSNGALVIANNDWQDDPAQATIISAAGLAPTNNLESGIAATLAPGFYTALLAGQNNTTGVGLVEVYDRGIP
jgi:hypothetical protein